MHKVKCPHPDCPEQGKIREVQAKKSWMVGVEPYEKLCKSCSQKGKLKTEEHKQKLSESVKKTQTPEVLDQKSKFAKANPQNWKGKLVEGGGAGWNKGMTLPARSEETKAKISNSMKGKNRK